MGIKVAGMLRVPRPPLADCSVVHAIPASAIDRSLVDAPCVSFLQQVCQSRTYSTSSTLHGVHWCEVVYPH